MTTPALRSPLRRRSRRTVLFALVAAVAVLLLALSVGGSSQGQPADPDSPARDGTRALVEVLRQQGVVVEVVRSIEAFESTPIDAGTTAVIGSFAYLGAAAAQRAAIHYSDAGRVVLLEPNERALADLGVPLVAAGRTDTQLSARCSSTVAHPTDRLSGITSWYRTPPGERPAAGLTRCFEQLDATGAPGDGSSRGEPGAAVVILGATGTRPETVVFGALAALANAAVTQESHAAIGLRLLSAHPRVVWYYPGVTDLDVPDPNGRHLADAGRGVPPWLTPGALLLSLAFLAFALARGRRLGRIVPEPLPVVVRAVETTEARGRLYRRAADRGRAASSLRAGTRARLASRLGLPRGAAFPELLEAVARSANRPAQEILPLLDGPTPDNDSALLLLAQQLAQLEESVRHA